MYIYCHTSLKPYYCFCELRIVIADTEADDDNETDTHTKTYALATHFNASNLELQQSHNSVRTLNINTTTKARTHTEPMWLWFGYKRIDSQRNNKQKNNGLMSLVSLLLLAYRIQWHWYVIVLWRLVLITSPNALGACVSQSVCHLQWSVNLPYNNENVYISREREKKIKYTGDFDCKYKRDYLSICKAWKHLRFVSDSWHS